MEVEDADLCVRAIAAVLVAERAEVVDLSAPVFPLRFTVALGMAFPLSKLHIIHGTDSQTQRADQPHVRS